MIQNYLKILELSPNFTKEQLRNNYFSKAKLYHPDKNLNNKDKKLNEIKFKELINAYSFLNDLDNCSSVKENNNNLNNINNSHLTNEDNIIKKFLFNSKNFTNNFILNILKFQDKTTLIKLKKFIETYNQVFEFPEFIINEINYLLKNKQINNFYDKKKIITKILNPSLKQLLNKEIYVFNFNDENYYIPLWHHQMIIDCKINNNKILILCNPELPDYLSIDENNNIFFNLNIKIEELTNSEKIKLNFLDKSYFIPTSKLFFKSHQYYIFKNEGIPKINYKNILDTSINSDLIINILIEGLNN